MTHKNIYWNKDSQNKVDPRRAKTHGTFNMTKKCGTRA